MPAHYSSRLCNPYMHSCPSLQHEKHLAPWFSMISQVKRTPLNIPRPLHRRISHCKATFQTTPLDITTAIFTISQAASLAFMH